MTPDSLTLIVTGPDFLGNDHTVMFCALPDRRTWVTTLEGYELEVERLGGEWSATVYNGDDAIWYEERDTFEDAALLAISRVGL